MQERIRTRPPRRRRTFLCAVVALLLCVLPLLADKKSPERRKLDELNDVSKRLNAIASKQELRDEQRFLNEWVAKLLTRAREAPAGSYLFSRLVSAMDDFLDGSEELQKMVDDDDSEEDSEDGARRRTARELESAYFRVKQGDYFAEQSREKGADQIVKTAGRLYQLARREFDEGRYWRARRLADGARECIDGLESLAQAAVEVPDPPKL